MRLILFIIVAIVQLGSIGWMLGSRELMLRKGQAVRFIVEPVDPYDPFRGRYVALNFAESDVEYVGDFDYGDTAYGVLEVDPEGYARITELVPEAPEGKQLYLRVEVLGLRWRDAVGDKPSARVTQVKLPFDRYYMNEHAAPEAERIYREAVGRQAEANETAKRENYLVARILDGKAVAQSLVLRGEVF